MTIKERCILAIEKGYVYNPDTGEVFNKYNNLITSTCYHGYIRFNLKFNFKIYVLKAHQFAWYWINKETVDCLDHINGIKTDNRIINLRSITIHENHFNRIKAKGYCFHKRDKKWQASIEIDGKNIHLGYYTNEEDARNTYLNAKLKYHKIE